MPPTFRRPVECAESAAGFEKTRPGFAGVSGGCRVFLPGRSFRTGLFLSLPSGRRRAVPIGGKEERSPKR